MRCALLALPAQAGFARMCVCPCTTLAPASNFPEGPRNGEASPGAPAGLVLAGLRHIGLT